MDRCHQPMLLFTLAGAASASFLLGGAGYLAGSAVAVPLGQAWASVLAGLLGAVGALAGAILGAEGGVLAWVWLRPRNPASP